VLKPKLLKLRRWGSLLDDDERARVELLEQLPRLSDVSPGKKSEYDSHVRLS
jgi:hypothetical protein